MIQHLGLFVQMIARRLKHSIQLQELDITGLIIRKKRDIGEKTIGIIRWTALLVERSETKFFERRLRIIKKDFRPFGVDSYER